MRTNGLIRGIRERNIPALARAISLVENTQSGYEQLLSSLHSMVGNAHRIGVTGPPGAGKSTLTECLIQGYRRREQTVAVVAVDPTSPLSGGALLGDRIRMESVTLDPGVYIRSMAARGATGGLAMTTREVCDVLDAFGFDRIIIETVGVGQSEISITANADTAVLVLVPESGDGVQVLKAGVMEIADIFVVNKADRPGAERIVLEVEVMLGLRQGNAYRHVAPHLRPGDVPKRPSHDRSNTWTPPALTTVAVRNEGVDELLTVLDQHVGYLKASGELEQRRRERLEQHTREVVDRAVSAYLWGDGSGQRALADNMDGVVRGQKSPYKLAQEIVAGLRKGTEHQ